MLIKGALEDYGSASCSIKSQRYNAPPPHTHIHTLGVRNLSMKNVGKSYYRYQTKKYNEK